MLPQTPAPVSSWDAVLIDDDPLIHRTWCLAAHTHDKRLLPLHSAAEFFALCDQISRDVPIYIDSELGEGLYGEVIAEGIYKQGFHTIYLATGRPPGSVDPADYPWLKSVIGKEVPFTY